MAISGRQLWWRILMALLVAGAVAAELVAALDRSEWTEPWTTLIIRYVPAWVTLPVIVLFAAWLLVHFGKRYYARRRQ